MLHSDDVSTLIFEFHTYGVKLTSNSIETFRILRPLSSTFSPLITRCDQTYVSLYSSNTLTSRNVTEIEKIITSDIVLTQHQILRIYSKINLYYAIIEKNWPFITH